MDQVDTGKLLRLEAVIALIGMKRSWILQKTKDGKFPKPLRLSPRAVAWRQSDVLEWIDAQELAD
jgi:prophage regulatory protein|tara:strand:- start:342 stop:536 length:195 start_codon:yes stop_codon:yes gene_type:complete